MVFSSKALKISSNQALPIVIILVLYYIIGDVLNGT